MNYKKQATTFRRKYKLKQINSKSLCDALNMQGYTVIEFNGVADSEDVIALRNSLHIGTWMDQSRCFTYRDDKFRLVFIHEGLNEEERTVALAHEEGHIWNDHMLKDNILGNDVIQEHQANEFAHYLIKDRDGKKRRAYCISVICIIALLLIGVCSGVCIKNMHDKAVYTDFYYRTETGGKYHLRNCMYLKNKTDIYRLTKEEFYSGNYEPCEACKPDER